MIEPRDLMPLGFDGFLKLWALSNPRIAAEYILLDEAQDTNPVVLSVLQAQDAQVGYVGDRYQQIYEWRGAVNAMEAVRSAHSTSLTRSFRFGDAIAHAASAVLRTLGETNPISGNPLLASYIGTDHADAILARTNASVIAVVISTLEEGKRPFVVGGTADIVRMLRGVQDLRLGQPSDVPEFFGFANWNEVIEFSRSGDGEHLRTFVKLVENFGEAQLIQRLGETSQNEADADVTVSTAHKAKGREWNTVRLVDDFLKSTPAQRADPSTMGSKIDPSEIRLFYVALTRAREAVEVPISALEMFGITPGPRRPLSAPLPRIPMGPAEIEAPRVAVMRTDRAQPLPQTDGESVRRRSGPRWWVWLVVAGAILAAFSQFD